MTLYNRDDGWDTEEAGQKVVEAKTKRSHSGRPKVLARLPDLDVAELDRILDTESGAGQRSFNQRISTAILMGGGALFLLLALSPLVSNKSDKPAGNSTAFQPTSPAPSAPVAPAWNTARTAPAAPAPTIVKPANDATISIPAAIPAPPTEVLRPSDVNMPKLPDQSQTWPRPAPQRPTDAMGFAGGTQRLAPPPATTNMPMPNNYPTTPFAGYETVPANPAYYGSVQASANQPVSVADRTAMPGVGSRYPTTAVEPGVARLDGTIDKTPYRPNYDSARPSLH